MSNTQVRSGGIGFLGMLTILFIGLKLTNFIDWSWWWVLAPLWLPLAVVLGILAVVFVIAAIVYTIAAICTDKKITRPRSKYRGL